MTAGIRVSVTQLSAPASMEYNTVLPFGLFRFFNMNMQSSYFCRGPDDFCWGPAPIGSTLVTGLISCFIPKTFAVKLPLSCKVVEKRRNYVVLGTPIFKGRVNSNFGHVFTSEHVACFG